MALIEISRPNLEIRQGLVRKCDLHIQFRAQVREMCRRDICFWVNNFCYTYDPRNEVSTILPMVMFPKQEEYLQWVQQIRAKKQHAIVEKSRDMGLSWLNCYYHLHCWLFEEGYKGTMGSRKQALVDQAGNMDSLFEKMRFTIKHLPEWMVPEHRDKLEVLHNKENGSMLTGESSKEAGRGGRSSVYFVDEGAFIEQADKVDMAISQNSDVVLWCSTPNGVANLFYRKRHSGKLPVFTFLYTDHPGKDEAWLTEQREKLEEIVIAREIMIDYFASRERVLFPNKWVRAAVNFFDPGGGKKIAGLDVADEGGDSNVFVVRQGNRCIFKEKWREGTTTVTAQRARNLCEEHGISVLQYDANGVGAGVRGEMARLDQSRKLKFATAPINFGRSASDVVYPQFDDRTGKEIFMNCKAEMFWLLRRRFEKTYELLNGIKDHPLSETISIPDDPVLIEQLAVLQFDFKENGLIAVTSKLQLRKDGIASPDEADALCMAFAETDAGQFAWWR